MLNYTIVEVVRQQHLEQLRRKPIEVEGAPVYEAGRIRRGLDHIGGLLGAAKQRLQAPAGPVGLKSTLEEIVD